MGDVNKLKKTERNKTMAILPGSIKNLNTLLGEQLLDGEGGGGGSSDFSTAEVTVICNVGSASIDDGWWIVNNKTESYVDISEGTTNLEIVLYKGENSCAVSCNASVSVSGGATATKTPLGTVVVTITGDCTITIS